MITIGVDFHKRTSTYHVLDPNGQKMKHCKLENRPELMKAFLEALPGPKLIAIEATRNWGLFYETVKPYCDQFLLGHPKKMKVITESETKHDKADAQAISQLAYGPFFPKAHVSTLKTRQLRSVLRFRYFLTNQRKAIRNQIQTLLDRNLWPYERPKAFKDPFCDKGLRWLKGLDLPDNERVILDNALLIHERLTKQITDLEELIEREACDFPGLEYLRTVPGFRKSKVNIYTVLLELGDIDRFRKAKHLTHYAGLIPRERSSGDTYRKGHLIRGANQFLRTALIESTFGALRADRALRAYYKQVKDRAGSSAAIIACARKLSYAVYHVLKDKTSYRPSPTAIVLSSTPKE